MKTFTNFKIKFMTIRKNSPTSHANIWNNTFLLPYFLLQLEREVCKKLRFYVFYYKMVIQFRVIFSSLEIRILFLKALNQRT